jgi:hypothetical protein
MTVTAVVEIADVAADVTVDPPVYGVATVATKRVLTWEPHHLLQDIAQ